MSRRSPSPTRRAELVELTRQPAPPSYNHTPRNREQRRQLARALRQASRRVR